MKLEFLRWAIARRCFGDPILAVFIQYRRVTDGQAHDNIIYRAVKTLNSLKCILYVYYNMVDLLTRIVLHSASFDNVCVKVGWHCGVRCDPDSRDELGTDQTGINIAGDVVRSHLPGVKATPVIVERCLYTVSRRHTVTHYDCF